ncbi:MAG: hypothetical protein HY673_14010, partial [Chloroflexi bacterium]|nr:hypothetical protein [Chloroflexota bacterium]
FDLLAFINVSGTGAPITLKDAAGNVISSRVLTNADVVPGIGGTSPTQLAGRFRITSPTPFTEIDFALTNPGNGGFGIDNLTFIIPIPAQGFPLTIDFSGLPGPDGIPRTPDDIPFTSYDTLSTGPGGARIIDDEYSSVGVRFSGAAGVGAIGGGWNPDGSPNTSGSNLLLEDIIITDEATGATGGIAPTNIHFTHPQTEISFDLLAFINVSGTGAPITLKDALGNVISSRVLTNADVVPGIGGTSPTQLAGRFRITSPTPFSEIDFALTNPGNGGFGIDNLTFKVFPPEPPPTPIPSPSPSPIPSPTPSPTPTAFLPGDVNGDGVVNMTDLNLLMASFNKRSVDAGFNPNADFNGDGIVDVYDLVILGLRFGG